MQEGFAFGKRSYELIKKRSNGQVQASNYSDLFSSKSSSFISSLNIWVNASHLKTFTWDLRVRKKSIFLKNFFFILKLDG